MLDAFKAIVGVERLRSESSRILLAISGGIDSMVMLHLAIASGQQIAIAHVNHNTRNGESDKDEQLVKEIAAHNDIAYHVYIISDDEITSGNFQEQARNIRYGWMYDLCSKYGYSALLTAHHSDDNIETFLINFLRGSGGKGLSGIPDRNDLIIRPLLSFSKADIEQYAESNHVVYREDKSNATSDYLRNEIRNEWIPMMTKGRPSAKQGMNKSILHIKNEYALLEELNFLFMDQISQVDDRGYMVFSIQKLFQLKWYKSSVYQYFKRYKFSKDNLDKILIANTGAVVFSDSHEILKNRDQIILRVKALHITIEFEVDSYGCYDIQHGKQLSVSSTSSEKTFEVSNIEFPFVIRSWRSGDFMQPSGMGGQKQKVKDLLTNNKLDLWRKQSTLVIEKDKEIISILPYRNADGYSNSAKHIMYFSFVK